MAEHPILFSAPMVRAILEGRKTQTRRVIRGVIPAGASDRLGGALEWDCIIDRDYLPSRLDYMANGTDLCPYGAVGDRLWVKEGWRPSPLGCTSVSVKYLAGGPSALFPGDAIPADWKIPKAAERGNVTALFMPRWASRITLEITDVRVQRVQEISEEDAAAEGCWWGMANTTDALQVTDDVRGDFRWLWDSINDKRGYSWQSNPWVWCVSFRRVQ